jgi:hypothetical protein
MPHDLKTYWMIPVGFRIRNSNVWLPFDFEPTPQPEISDGHWPVPLLSSHRLLSELNEIQRLSDLGLGNLPTGYEVMRSNPKEFYRSKIKLDNTTLMQWIRCWRDRAPRKAAGLGGCDSLHCLQSALASHSAGPAIKCHLFVTARASALLRATLAPPLPVRCFRALIPDSRAG